jgi:DNA-binding IclR family transcriptional regulator
VTRTIKSVENATELVEHLQRLDSGTVSELAEASGLAAGTVHAHLIIEHDGHLFSLYERFGEKAVGVEYHDRKREQPLNHLHCTAAGKAILSQLPESDVREITTERGVPQNTEHTITDVEELIEELAVVRDRGYAFADEEQMSGIRALGAPVTPAGERVAGAIAVSGPTSRLKNETFREELPDLVVEAANICEVNLHTIRTQSLEGTPG